jgi:hypothetical protein
MIAHPNTNSQTVPLTFKKKTMARDKPAIGEISDGSGTHRYALMQSQTLQKKCKLLHTGQTLLYSTFTSYFLQTMVCS